MVQGLDGIERIIRTINPETLEFDTYRCCGYYNTGNFIDQGYDKDNNKIPDKLRAGKLVDWYKPDSGKGEGHSLEYLELLHKIDKRPYDVKVKGEEL